MFNDRYSLTKAVLEGRKTMTRRVARPLSSNINHMKYGYLEEGANMVDGRLIYRIGQKLFVSTYRIGEVVAVAQSYHDIWSSMVDGTAHANQCYKFYREHQSSAGWSNKMFVRPDLMPHRIRITNIKVEQLQDIADWECLAEGIVRADLQVIGHETLYSTNNTPAEWYAESARTAYATLIDKISGKGTWYKNPYVFAYTFELIKKS